MPSLEFYRLEAKLVRFAAKHPVRFVLSGLGIALIVASLPSGMIWLADWILKGLGLVQ